MLRVVNPPAGESICEDFEILLDNSVKVSPYTARVSAMPYNTVWPGYQRPLDQTEIASFFSFEADKPVSISISVKHGFEEAVVRPLSKSIKAEKQGNCVTFTLQKPGQYSVEFDGIHSPLTIFYNPIRDFIGLAGKNSLYYGPGQHFPGTVYLEDGQTVIVDSGAVVYGSFVAIDKKNIKILGYGIIDGSHETRTSDTLLLPYSDDAVFSRERMSAESFKKWLAENRVLNGCVRLYRCENCELGDFVCRDSASFTVIPAACDNVVCDNLKLIGMWRYNSDGIDFFNSKDCAVRNCYLRDFDDCMVIKGIKGWDFRNNENILVENCLVWCDWGRALEIGAETCADRYNNITFRNCDLIHGTHIYMDVQNGDRANVTNVLYEDIRCEYDRYRMHPVYQHDMAASYPNPRPEPPCKLMFTENYCGKWSKDNLLGSVSGVTYRNIQVFSDGLDRMPPSYFKSANADHTTSNVTIDGLYFNGKRITSLEEANITLKEFTKDVTII